VGCFGVGSLTQGSEMNARYIATLLAITSQTWSGVGLAACPVTKTTKVPDGATIRTIRQTPTFLSFRSGLRVNTDGAANSYHPIGKSKGALNTICNGIAVYPVSGPYKGQRVSSIAPTNLSGDERCQIILDIFRESLNANYAIPKSGTIDWYALAMEPGAPPTGFYRPCIQNNGQFRGFFVAQTAKSGDPNKPVCDPAHWLSSTEIPYITLPKGSKAFADAKAGLGDLALMHRRVENVDRWVVAIVADVGNSSELGEGSIFLHHALGSPTKGVIPQNLSADVTTFLFPASAPSGSISAAALASESVKVGLIAKAGGKSVLEACLIE
jgi:hypothetical protein